MHADTHVLLSGWGVLTPDATVSRGWVQIRGQRITGVGAGTPARPAEGEEHLVLTGCTVVPGFIDLHVHGGGASFVQGAPAAVPRARTFHRRGGTTRSPASLVSTPVDALVDALASLAEDGVIEGIHLEDPFLAPGRCGAHDPRSLRPPERALLERLLDAGRGQVRMVTLAPELPGAIDRVRRLVDVGVIAAIGHSDADDARAQTAIDAGATVATHLFNAMRPLQHRGPGIAGAALEREEVACALIVDGHHLADATARLAFAAAPRRCALVTAAIAAAGTAEGRSRLGPVEVEVAPGAPSEGTPTIAGSTVTSAAALRHAVRARLPLAQASAAASTLPATLLNRASGLGTIAVDTLADLVVLDADLEVEVVFVAGERVAPPAARVAR